MQITFVLGNGCNFNCTYCFERNKMGNKRLNIEAAKRLLDDVYGVNNPFEIDNKEPHILEFIGGEPLLYIDIITDIVEYFENILHTKEYNQDYQLRFVTNGALLDSPKIADFVAKYGQYIYLNCSIDGIKASHDKFRVDVNGNGTYDKVWDNFINAKVRSKNLKWTLTGDTAKYYADAIKFMLNQQDISNFKISQHFNNEDENLATYGYKDFSDCVCELIRWYREQDPMWIIKHPFCMERCDFRPPFVDYYAHLTICATHKVCLDIDGSLIKCLCASEISMDRPDSFVYGNVLTTEGEDRIKMYKKAFAPIYVYEGIKDMECFRCPIGNFCGSCYVSNYCHTCDADHILRYVCNCYAMKHFEHVFFNNFWIKTYLDNVKDAKTYMLNDTTMLVGEMFRKDLLLPECWALEIMPKDIYKYVCDITEEIGGMVTPLETKYFTEEQVKAIADTLSKNTDIVYNQPIPDYRERVMFEGGK